MFRIFLFFLGICVGSFLNVIIFRLEKKEKITGRSYCDSCKKKIKFYDLVPLLSFLLLRGKCRYCNQKIKSEYFLVELATGLLFVLFGFNILLFFIAVLIIIFVYDFKHYLIPDIILTPAILLALIFFSQNWFAALIASGFFAFLVLISKETWMGWGDVKLAVLMGLLLGWPNILLALFISFVFGAICGIILIAIKSKTIKSQMPFGPFLVGATIICLYLNHLLLLNSWWSYVLLGF